MRSIMRRQNLDAQHTEMAWYLACHGLHQLYHFTSITNLKLIFRRNRIYSRRQLQERHLSKQVEMGGSVPKSHAAHVGWASDDYVSLSYGARLPMAIKLEQIRHLCYFVFPIRVALLQGAVFTDVNAGSSRVSGEPGLAGLKKVDLSAVTAGLARRSSEKYDARQAEVLVPHAISVGDIQYVAFRSQASLEEAARQCEGIADLPLFQVDPRLFQFGKPPFFGTENIVLINRHRFAGRTTKSLNDTQLSKLLSGPSAESRPGKISDGVTVVQAVHTCRFLEPVVKWIGPTGRRIIVSGLTGRQAAFDSVGRYDIATTLGPEDLSPGRWRVECSLRLADTEVKQANIRFEMH